jgi:hypothetical protein
MRRHLRENNERRERAFLDQRATRNQPQAVNSNALSIQSSDNIYAHWLHRKRLMLWSGTASRYPLASLARVFRSTADNLSTSVRPPRSIGRLRETKMKPIIRARWPRCSALPERMGRRPGRKVA